MQVNRLPAEVFHPSEYIRDEVDERGWTREQFCVMCELPEREALGLLQGVLSVTPPRAIALAKAFGTSATTWYRMQRTFDAGPATAKQELP